MNFVLLSNYDNVVTLLENARKGDTIIIGENIIEITDDASFGHKIAIQEIEKGEKLIKYGEIIGAATEQIKIGSHAHVHNIESLRVRYDLEGSDAK